MADFKIEVQGGGEGGEPSIEPSRCPVAAVVTAFATQNSKTLQPSIDTWE